MSMFLNRIKNKVVNFDLQVDDNLEDMEQDYLQIQLEKEKEKKQKQNELAPPNEILDKKYDPEDMNYKVVLKLGGRTGYYKYGGLYMRDGTAPTGSFLERLEQMYRSKYQSVTLQQIFDQSNNLLIYDKYTVKKMPQRRRGFRFTSKDNRMPFQLLMKKFNIVKINEDQIKDKQKSLHISYQTKQEQDQIDEQILKMQGGKEIEEKQKEDPLLKEAAKFDSKFESGNLAKVVRIGDNEYNLLLQNDINTKGFNKWFYFKVQNVKPDTKVVFNIVNFKKKYSLFNDGLEISIHSEKGQELHNQLWFKGGEDIAYVPNGIKIYKKKKKSQQENNNDQKDSPTKKAKKIDDEDDDDEGNTYYTLRFQYTFLYEEDTVSFALTKPYTYNQEQAYIESVKKNWYQKQFTKHKIIAQSLGGFNIDTLTITNEKPQNQTVDQKVAVLIMARAHPGESVSSHVMKGMLDFLLMRDNELGELLRDNFIFKVFPMLNPDGVICGNNRCSLSGEDINRKWKEPSEQKYPEIFHTKQEIEKFNEEHQIKIVLDLHSTTRKKFFSSTTLENESSPQKPRLFNYLLSKLNANYKYSLCDYIEEEKQCDVEGTPILQFFNDFDMDQMYTIEASVQGTENLKDINFISKDYEDFGHSICLTLLLQYLDNYDAEKLQKSYKSYATQCFLQNFKQGDNFFNEIMNVNGDLIYNKEVQLHEFQRDYQDELAQKAQKKIQKEKLKQKLKDQEQNSIKTQKKQKQYDMLDLDSQIGTDSQYDIDNLSDLEDLFPPPPPPPPQVEEEDPDALNSQQMEQSNYIKVSSRIMKGSRGSISPIRTQRQNFPLKRQSTSVSPLKRMSQSIKPIQRGLFKRGSMPVNMMASQQLNNNTSKQLNFISKKDQKQTQTSNKNLDQFVQTLQEQQELQKQQQEEEQQSQINVNNLDYGNTSIENQNKIDNGYSESVSLASSNNQRSPHKNSTSSPDISGNIRVKSPLQSQDSQQALSPFSPNKILKRNSHHNSNGSINVNSTNNNQQGVSNSYDKLRRFFDGEVNYSPEQVAKLLHDTQNQKKQKDKFLSLEQRRQQQYVEKQLEKFQNMQYLKDNITQFQKNQSLHNNSQQSLTSDIDQNVSILKQKMIRKNAYRLGLQILQKVQNGKKQKGNYDVSLIKIMNASPQQKNRNNLQTKNSPINTQQSQSYKQQNFTQMLESLQQQKQEEGQLCSKRSVIMSKSGRNSVQDQNQNQDQEKDQFCNLSSQEFYKNLKHYNLEQLQKETNSKIFHNPKIPTQDNLIASPQQYKKPQNQIKKIFSQGTTPYNNSKIDEKQYYSSSQQQLENNEKSLQEQQKSLQQIDDDKEVDRTIDQFLKTQYFHQNIKPQITYDMANRTIRENSTNNTTNNSKFKQFNNTIGSFTTKNISQSQQQAKNYQNSPDRKNILKIVSSPNTPAQLKNRQNMNISSNSGYKPKYKDTTKNLFVKTQFLQASKQKFIPILKSKQQMQQKQYEEQISPLKQRQITSQMNQKLPLKQNSIMLLNSEIDKQIQKSQQQKKQQMDKQIKKEINKYNAQFESLQFPQQTSNYNSTPGDNYNNNNNNNQTQIYNNNINIQQNQNFMGRSSNFTKKMSKLVQSDRLQRPATQSPSVKNRIIMKNGTNQQHRKSLQDEEKLYQEILEQVIKQQQKQP